MLKLEKKYFSNKYFLKNNFKKLLDFDLNAGYIK